MTCPLSLSIFSLKGARIHGRKHTLKVTTTVGRKESGRVCALSLFLSLSMACAFVRAQTLATTCVCVYVCLYVFLLQTFHRAYVYDCVISAPFTNTRALHFVLVRVCTPILAIHWLSWSYSFTGAKRTLHPIHSRVDISCAQCPPDQLWFRGP